MRVSLCIKNLKHNNKTKVSLFLMLYSTHTYSGRDGRIISCIVLLISSCPCEKPTVKKTKAKIS